MQLHAVARVQPCVQTSSHISAAHKICPWTLQGVDWRDPRAQGCNAGRNPIQESFYDGVNADPLEVLFVKVKASMHQAHWQHVLQVTHLPHTSDLPGH
jgi:hypothetical protein